MGKIVELTVRKGCIRKGIRREYTLKAQIDDEAEIQTAKAHMEGLIDGWLSPYITTETLKKEVKKVEVQKFDPQKYEQLFPEDMRGLLNFEDGGEYVKVTPRQYLGAENFAKIAQIVREKGGDYISAGKDSHFRIPKNAI